MPISSATSSAASCSSSSRWARCRKSLALAGPRYPAGDVNLRVFSDHNYVIQDLDTGKVIGELDEWGAFTSSTEAVYMREGETYFVNELNLTERIAYVGGVSWTISRCRWTAPGPASGRFEEPPQGRSGRSARLAAVRGHEPGLHVPQSVLRERQHRLRHAGPAADAGHHRFSGWLTAMLRK